MNTSAGRVIKPGGQASILDWKRAASDEALECELEQMKLSRWNIALTDLAFRHCYARTVLTAVAESRCQRCEILEEGAGLELLLQKPIRISV